MVDVGEEEGGAREEEEGSRRGSAGPTIGAAILGLSYQLRSSKDKASSQVSDSPTTEIRKAHLECPRSKQLQEHSPRRSRGVLKKHVFHFS